jgi:hypothetical protein
MKHKSPSLIPAAYAPLLADLKARVRAAQVTAVDDQMRHEHDAPSIGLLLCKDARNRVKVEYALRDVKKPIGVAEWQTRLVESLPKKLRGSLPSIADIERELNKPRLPAKRRKSKS